MATVRMNKYTYYKVLQEYTQGWGWDDAVFYDKSDPKQMQECKDDVRSYRREGINVRVINRRELNKQYL